MSHRISYGVSLLALIFAIGCGDAKKRNVGFDLNSVNLSEDTVPISIPLSLEQTTDANGNTVVRETANFGFSNVNTQSPLSFNKIHKARLIALDDQGKRHLIGESAEKSEGQTELQLADSRVPSAILAEIQFFSEPQIHIVVDLLRQSGQEASIVVLLREMFADTSRLERFINNPEQALKFFVHFERKN